MEAGALARVVALAREWTEAWNERDGERIARTVHEDFRMHQLKGEVVDIHGLRDALARQTYGVAIKVLPRALYGRADRFAVTARVEYRHVEDNELMGAEEAGIALEVREGLILRAAPQAGPQETLEAGGLTTADLIFEWPERPA